MLSQPDAAKRLFRQEALDRLTAPEHLDTLLQATSPRAWLALAGLGILVVLGLLWGLLGSVPATVTAQGMLVRAGGSEGVAAPVAGRVSAIAVRPGEAVTAGEVVATLYVSDSSTPLAVKSATAGRVLAVSVGNGDLVTLGTPLLTLEPAAGTLELALFVPLSEQPQIRPGMEVQVSPSGFGRDQYGFLRGVVRTVGDFPATNAELQHTLGTAELARTFAAGGAPIEVDVALTPGSATPSGYAWSLGVGPSTALHGGTLATATIVLSTHHLISLGQ